MELSDQPAAAAQPDPTDVTAGIAGSSHERATEPDSPRMSSATSTGSQESPAPSTAGGDDERGCGADGTAPDDAEQGETAPGETAEHDAAEQGDGEQDDGEDGLAPELAGILDFGAVPISDLLDLLLAADPATADPATCLGAVRGLEQVIRHASARQVRFIAADALQAAPHHGAPRYRGRRSTGRN